MRLIDADLLLDKLGNLSVKNITDDNMLEVVQGIFDIVKDTINSAPAVSGEAVGIVTGLSIAGNPREFEWYKPVRLGEKLHLSPPQPQSVKDALEKAIEIVKKYDSAVANPSWTIATEIRKLIEDK